MDIYTKLVRGYPSKRVEPASLDASGDTDDGDNLHEQVEPPSLDSSDSDDGDPVPFSHYYFSSNTGSGGQCCSQSSNIGAPSVTGDSNSS